MLQQLASGGQSNPEVPINESFDTLGPFAVFGRRHAAESGLTWAFHGGTWNGMAIADGTLTLTDATTNYIVANRSTGAVTSATTTTNWADVATYARLQTVVTAASAIGTVTDYRAGLWGSHGPAERLSRVSADRADTSQTLTVGTDATTQRWATTLTANRTVTLSTTGAINGDRFRIVRTGLGAFTLDVGGLKTIPSATAAWVDVEFTGSAWVLTGYGTL
jgi:hypothetical protein